MYSAAPMVPFLTNRIYNQNCLLSLRKAKSLAASDHGLTLFLQPDLILSKQLPMDTRKPDGLTCENIWKDFNCSGFVPPKE